MSESELGSKNGFRAGKECEMPECSSTGALKACRGPDGNLIDMCPTCRSAWPAEVLEG